MIHTHEICRLTDAPEIKYNADGNISVASFTTATDRYTSSGNKTDFVRHVAFGHNATFAERYLKKGTKVFIEGHIQTGSYEKDGRKVYTTEIVVDEFEFCESKAEKDESDRVKAIEETDRLELPFK